MKEHIEYERENELHIFRWKTAHRAAVDGWLTQMTDIMNQEKKLGYVLIDFSEIDLPPVRYLAKEVRRWLTQHVATDPGATVAVIYPVSNMPFLIVARSYSATLGRERPLNLEFFPSDNSEAAYDWLNQQYKKNQGQ